MTVVVVLTGLVALAALAVAVRVRGANAERAQGFVPGVVLAEAEVAEEAVVLPALVGEGVGVTQWNPEWGQVRAA